MKSPVSPPDPRPNPGTCSSALGLARATLGEGVRDPAVIAATALLTAIVLSLHATTQFALGAEDLLRAEMASATLGLGAAAVVAVSLFRVGGVEVRDGTAVPLWATPLSRGGWAAGRILGLSAVASLGVSVLAVAAASVGALASRCWGAAALGGVALVSAAGAWVAVARGTPGRTGSFVTAVAAVAGVAALLASPPPPAGAPGLLLSAGGAVLAGGALAAAGVAASLAVPPSGAATAVVVLYVLGHASGPAMAGAGPAARVGLRALVPDLGGIAAGAALAGACGAAGVVAYAVGMTLLAIAAARAREA